MGTIDFRPGIPLLLIPDPPPDSPFPTMDQQKSVLQGLWRKAGRQDEPLEIACASNADAKRLRFALYNAVREFKPTPKGDPAKKLADPALQMALDKCSVSFHEQDSSIIIIRQKTSSAMMQAAMAVLGEERILDEMDVAAEASFALVQKKLAEPQEPGEYVPGTPRVTPYYTR